MRPSWVEGNANLLTSKIKRLRAMTLPDKPLCCLPELFPFVPQDSRLLPNMFRHLPWQLSVPFPWADRPRFLWKG